MIKQLLLATLLLGNLALFAAETPVDKKEYAFTALDKDNNGVILAVKPQFTLTVTGVPEAYGTIAVYKISNSGEIATDKVKWQYQAITKKLTLIFDDALAGVNGEVEFGFKPIDPADNKRMIKIKLDVKNGPGGNPPAQPLDLPDFVPAKYLAYTAEGSCRSKLPECPNSFHIQYNPCCDFGNCDKWGNSISELAPMRKGKGELWSFADNGKSAIAETADPNCNNCPFGMYRITHPRKLYAKYKFPLAFHVININPYKYNVTIIKNDTSYNEAEAAMLTNWLKSWIEKNMPTSQGTDGKAEAPVKEMLIKMGNQLAQYIQMKKYGDDCIDLELLRRERNHILANIDTVFRRAGVTYATIPDLIAENIAKLDEKAKEHKDDKDKTLLEEISNDKKALEGVLKVYSELRAMSFNYTYLIPQVQNHDEIIYTLTIEPKDKGVHGFRSIEEQIKIPVRGGVKIDGSLGVYYSSITDQHYYAQRDSFFTLATNGRDTLFTKGNRVLSGNGGIIGQFGAAAFIHFYSRTGKPVNVALTLGMGVPFKKTPLPHGLVGASLILGTHSRVAITGGFSFGVAERLKSEYKQPGLYGDVSTLTEKKLAWGAFIGLSYNFVPTQKTKVEAPAAAPKKEEPKKDEAASGGDSETKKDETEAKKEEEKPAKEKESCKHKFTIKTGKAGDKKGKQLVQIIINEAPIPPAEKKEEKEEKKKEEKEEEEDK